MATSSAPNRWIANPLVDLLCVGSLLAFGLYIGLQATGYRDPVVGLTYLAFALSVVCNSPHFMASYVRLYRSRESIMEYPLVSIVAPIVLLAGVVGTLYMPQLIGVWFIKAHTIWSGFHYAGQTYGIALIYCRKHLFSLAPWERWMLLAPIGFSFLMPIANFELGGGSVTFYGITYPSLNKALEESFGLGLPFELALVVGVGFVLSLLVMLTWMIVRYMRGGAFLPVAALLVIGSQMLWFTVVGQNPTFNLFVPFFHSLQYMVVVVAFHRSEWIKQGLHQPATYWRYFGLIILLGAFAFEGVPGMLAQSGYDKNLAYAAVIAFINLHHFMIDGVIWRLRKPEVSQALIPQADSPAEKPAVAA